MTHNSTLLGGGFAASSPFILDPIFALNSLVKPSLPLGSHLLNSRRFRRKFMASNLRTTNHLRHVESMTNLPSGADHISKLNAVILGEALASEEDDFVYPSKEFSSHAHVQSPEQVFRLSD